MIYIEVFMFAYIAIFMYLAVIGDQMNFSIFCRVKHNYNLSICKNNEIINRQILNEVTYYNSVNYLISTIPASFVSFLFGHIAGKKPKVMNILIFLSILSLTYRTFLDILFVNIKEFPTMLYIVLTALSCFISNFAATRSVILVYISFTTAGSSKTVRFLLLEVMIILASLAGNLYGSTMIQYTPLNQVLLCLFLLQIFGYAATCTIDVVESKNLPINVQTQPKKKFIERFAKIFKNLIEVLRENIALKLLLLLTSSLQYMGISGATSLLIPTCLLKKFSFSSLQIGILMGIIVIIKSIGGLIIVPNLLKVKRIKICFLIAFFGVFLMGFYLTLAFAKTRTHIYIAPIFVLFEAAFGALLNKFSFESCKDPSLSGTYIGFLNSLVAIGAHGGIVLANNLFKSFPQKYIGLPFLVIGSITFLSYILLSICSVLLEKNKSSIDFVELDTINSENSSSHLNDI